MNDILEKLNRVRWQLDQSVAHEARDTITALRAEVERLRNGTPWSDLAEAIAENTRLREALERPANMADIVEVGKAILPYIDNEKTQAIGAIAHDAMVTVANIFRARAALAQSTEQGEKA